jgi:hypothetical protein
MTQILTTGIFSVPEQDSIIPIRYPKKEIDPNIFSKFFNKHGKYPGKEKTHLEIGPVWEQCFKNWTLSTVDVFSAMEKEDLNHLKEIYEDYYLYGVSEGASSGKALSDNGGNGYQYKLNKAQRNIERTKKLSNHLGLNLTDVSKIYKKLNETIVIPESPNYGQTWGWWYNDIFIHFELTDYIYFFDTIKQIFDQLDITKTCFLGDGSGLLSTLVYNNYNINSSNHIDLSHFLLKQYLNNHNNDNINYYYAEDFKENTKYEADILINQDSFPEMSDKSVHKYVKNAKFNNVSYILSYNKEVTFEGGNPHSDFKSIFSSYGYNSIYRTNTIMREGYIIELFKLNK